MTTRTTAAGLAVLAITFSSATALAERGHGESPDLPELGESASRHREELKEARSKWREARREWREAKREWLKAKREAWKEGHKPDVVPELQSAGASASFIIAAGLGVVLVDRRRRRS